MIQKISINHNDNTIDIESVMSLSVVKEVNSETSVVPGCATASMLTVEIWGTANDYVSVGDEIKYYQLETVTNADGLTEEIFVQKGVFYAQKPTQKSKNLFEVVAYDNITKLDVDLTEWLSNEEEFKKEVSTIGGLINAVATRCGITINTDKVDSTLLNANVSWLGKVSLTGRQIISNIAQLLCKFVITDVSGNIVFDWYRESEIGIVPSGDGITSVSYKQGGLSAENYEIETVTGVAIVNSDTNVKYTYGETVGNILNISDNVVFNAIENAEDIKNILKAIYSGLRNLPINFKPCSIQLFSSDLIKVGTYVDVTDSNDVSFKTLIMKTTFSSSGLFVSSESEQNYNNYSSTALDNSGNATVDGKKITSISADKIKTGRVESNDGETYFDLDNSELITKSEEIVDETKIKNITKLNSGQLVVLKYLNDSEEPASAATFANTGVFLKAGSSDDIDTFPKRETGETIIAYLQKVLTWYAKAISKGLSGAFSVLGDNEDGSSGFSSVRSSGLHVKKTLSDKTCSSSYRADGATVDGNMEVTENMGVAGDMYIDGALKFQDNGEYKNLSDFFASVRRVEVPANASVKITFLPLSSGTITISGTTSESVFGAWMLYGNTDNAYVYTQKESSNISATSSGRTITFSNSSTSTRRILNMIFSYGGIERME